MTKIKQLNDNIKLVSEIKAPQAIVHIKHSITLQQYKIWLFILQKYREFYESGDMFDEDGFFRFSRSDLNMLVGYELKTVEIKRDLIALRKEDIIISILEKGGEKAEEGMGFISYWRLTSKTIAISLPPFLQKVMQGLDQQKAMFQLLNWQIFNHFTGKYEAIIYKLCRDYIGVKKTPYMTIDEFKKYMGIKNGDYDDFKRLNVRVITEPVAKINKSTVSDIVIDDIVYRREGRKVIGLYFIISQKNQLPIPFLELEENLAFRFSKVHIPTTTQVEYLTIRTPEEIELCIERANEYGEGLKLKKKDIEYGAIYRKAITEGWHIGYIEKKNKKNEELEKRTKTRQNEEEESRKTEQRRQEEIQRNEAILERFDALSSEEKEEIKDQYFQTLNTFMKGMFKDRNEKSPTHKPVFIKYLVEKVEGFRPETQ